MMPQGPAVAIDLGTTNCCVAVFRRGKVEIIPNELGDCTTPSYVAFTDTRRLIGLAAKEQMDLNPSRTIFDVKSLLGRKFRDACVQDNMKNWPFEVVSINDKPHIVINTNNERNTYSAENICSMLFVKMKATAEAYLNQRVNNVVITVPAYFNEAQRQATRDAASIAGLYVLRVMNEQSAASFAFGFNRTFDRMRYVLIFDMGATHLTISIVSIEGVLYEVQWSASNTQLGGQSFDDRLVNHFVQKFKRKHKKDLTLDKRAMYRLRIACEDAKKTLSTLTEVSIKINSLIDDIDLETSLYRIRFEELNADLFSKAMQTVQRALSDAKLKTSNIKDIVLVGGSTRIPKLQYMLRALFKRKELTRSVNPDEAVAYGATLQAALMLGGEAALMMYDVTPYSLGIGTEHGTMTVLIKRNTMLPCEGSEMFTIPANESSMLIQVFEGESSMTKDNNLLSVIDFTGITPAPCGVTQIAVSFEAFLDGILHVTVMDCSTDSKNSIIKHKGRLSKADIERMFNDAETYRYEAARQRGIEAAKNGLKSYCFKIKSNLKNNNYVKLKSSLSYSDRNNLMRKCHETLKWFNANQEAEKEDYEKLLKNLQRGCNTIIVNSDDRKIFEHNPIPATQLVDNIKKNQRKLIMKIMF